MMNHSEYRFVELAMNGANNRNNITDIRTVKNFTGHKESYMTYFRYNDEMIEHFRERNSVGGFRGSAYADWLPIDIDSQDLQEAQDMLKKLVQHNFQEHEIDPNICRFYFSGAKGFHIMVPATLFNAKPSPDIHKRFRKVALTLTKGIKIDTAIYDKTRIFRLPNTINGKTGLYKIELYDFQALTMDIDEIKSMARQPSERLEIEKEFDVNEELAELFDGPLEQGKTIKNESVEGVQAKICMAKILEGVGNGSRDNSGVRVVAHLKQSGLTQKQIWAVLKEWNDSNQPALETYELERIFDQGLKEYQFGCHDHILKQYCDKRCIFYKEDWSRF